LATHRVTAATPGTPGPRANARYPTMYYAADPTTDDITTSDTDAIDERELEVLSHVREIGTAVPENGPGPSSPSSTHPAPAPRPDESKNPAAPHVSQRSIAQALGMSVGLTNAILKRLTEKGFLMMRRINHNNVHYLVTPAGIDQLSRRSYLYLRRTIGNVVRYKERIRAFCKEQKERGVQEIVLVGESDLTFILEWCSEKEGLGFRYVGSVGDVEIQDLESEEPSGSAVLSTVEDSQNTDRGSREIVPAPARVKWIISEKKPNEDNTQERPKLVHLTNVILAP